MSRNRISIDASERSALKLGTLQRLKVKQVKILPHKKSQNFTVFYGRFYCGGLCCAISLLVVNGPNEVQAWNLC